MELDGCYCFEGLEVEGQPIRTRLAENKRVSNLHTTRSLDSAYNSHESPRNPRSPERTGENGSHVDGAVKEPSIKWQDSFEMRLPELPKIDVGDDPVIVEVVKEMRKDPPMWRFIELSFVEWLYPILGSTVGWFDEEENSVDTLSMRLANDATFVRAAFSNRLSIFIQDLIYSYHCGVSDRDDLTVAVSGYIALLYFNKNTVREEVYIKKMSRFLEFYLVNFSFY
ncbi:ABC transporter B family member 6-like protein [Tanacetum coccineum]